MPACLGSLFSAVPTRCTADNGNTTTASTDSISRLDSSAPEVGTIFLVDFPLIEFSWSVLEIFK